MAEEDALFNYTGTICNILSGGGLCLNNMRAIAGESLSSYSNRALLYICCDANSRQVRCRAHFAIQSKLNISRVMRRSRSEAGVLRILGSLRYSRGENWGTISGATRCGGLPTSGAM